MWCTASLFLAVTVGTASRQKQDIVDALQPIMGSTPFSVRLYFCWDLALLVAVAASVASLLFAYEIWRTRPFPQRRPPAPVAMDVALRARG